MSTSTSENNVKEEEQIPLKKHPDTSKDVGGLLINDKDASNTKLVLEIMKNLAEYTRLQEETAVIIDGLKDELKTIMQERNTDTLTGTEHKASYKAVVSSRIDTTAIKKELPEVAAKYTRTTETRRFTFA